MSSPIEQNQKSGVSQESRPEPVGYEQLERMFLEMLREQHWPRRTLLTCPMCSASLQLLPFAGVSEEEPSGHIEFHKHEAGHQLSLDQRESQGISNGCKAETGRTEESTD
jgi:hypothetical protein